MPTFRLATDDDMRAIDSRNLAAIDELPHLYIPVGAVDIPLPPFAIEMRASDLMRTWGVAKLPSLVDYVRLYPDALVASCSLGQFVDRADLVYHGAEPAADFLQD